MKPTHLGFLSVSKQSYVSLRPTIVINMGENRTKRKLNNDSLDMLEWMLAIDFDSVEVRLTHKNVFQKYIQVLDEDAFLVKNAD